MRMRVRQYLAREVMLFVMLTLIAAVLVLVALATAGRAESSHGSAPTVSVSSVTPTSIRFCFSGPGISPYNRTVYQTKSAGADWPTSFHSTRDYPNGCITRSGLSHNTSRDFRARYAHYDDDDEHNDGPWSNGVRGTTSAGPPGPPTIFSSTNSISSITVGWHTPTTYGSTITGYSFRYRNSSDTDWTDWPTTLPATPRSLEVTNLLVSTSYQFLVQATSNLGNGSWSSILTASTKSPPNQVSGLIQTSVNMTRISLFWATPASNEPITGYEIQHRENTTPSPEWTTNSVAATQNSYTITDLSEGTNYEVRTRAESSEGWGPYSELLFVSTNADTFADQGPANFTVRQVNASDTNIVVGLSWDDVNTATAYQVERDVAGVISYFTTTDQHYEDDYIKAAADSGRLVYRVRASKAVDSATQYTPWSPRVSLQFYGTGEVVSPAVLHNEMAGLRTPEAPVVETRKTLEGAIDQATEATGFNVDTSGFINLLCLLPGLVVMGGAAWAGITYRILAPALAVAWVFFILSLFAAGALLAFPIVWPILLTVLTVLVGSIGMARKVGWI